MTDLPNRARGQGVVHEYAFGSIPRSPIYGVSVLCDVVVIITNILEHRIGNPA